MVMALGFGWYSRAKKKPVRLVFLGGLGRGHIELCESRRFVRYVRELKYAISREERFSVWDPISPKMLLMTCAWPGQKIWKKGGRERQRVMTESERAGGAGVVSVRLFFFLFFFASVSHSSSFLSLSLSLTHNPHFPSLTHIPIY